MLIAQQHVLSTPNLWKEMEKRLILTKTIFFDEQAMNKPNVQMDLGECQSLMRRTFELDRFTGPGRKRESDLQMKISVQSRTDRVDSLAKISIAAILGKS